jgi:small subunit ribosomal protein S14
MAKKSSVVKNERRKKTVARFAAVRKELKELIRKPSTPETEREEAIQKLQSLPRNANPIRVRNRCALTGRPRGVYAKFGLGRSMLRAKALSGELPGVKKSSW